MKYCIYCGSQMEDNANFCTHCGKQVKNLNNEPIVIKQRKDKEQQVCKQQPMFL